MDSARSLLPLLVAGLAAVAGCAPRPFTLTPDSASMTGYLRVSLEAEPGVDLDAVDRVLVGGVRAIDLRREADGLSFLVQGHPLGGEVDVTLRGSGEPLTVERGFSYEALPDPRFERVAAFGASLTQGVQDGVPNFHGSLHSPALQAARQLGAYFPVPALKPGLLPTIEVEHIGPPPDCVNPDPEEHASASASSIIGSLADPETGLFGFQWGREDPDIAVHNLAVGGTDLEDMIRGTDNFGLTFMSHLVYDPYASIDAAAPTQMEMLRALEPTLVLCTDTYGNDVISAILGEDGIDPGDITDAEDLLPAMEALVNELAATGAEVFLANVPRPSLLPATPSLRRYTISLHTEEAVAAGADPVTAEQEATARVDADIAEIDAIAASFNEALAGYAAGFDNVHVVDLFTEFDNFIADLPVIDGQQLTGRRFGGLVTLDGLHFTDTGYAVLANFFLEAIDAALGTSSERIDLSEVIRNDRRSPRALADAGFDASGCVD